MEDVSPAPEGLFAFGSMSHMERATDALVDPIAAVDEFGGVGAVNGVVVLGLLGYGWVPTVDWRARSVHFALREFIPGLVAHGSLS